MTWEEFSALIDYCCTGRPLGSGTAKKEDGKYYVFLKALDTGYFCYGVTPFDTEEQAQKQTEFVLQMINDVLAELGYNRQRVSNN